MMITKMYLGWVKVIIKFRPNTGKEDENVNILQEGNESIINDGQNVLNLEK